MNIFLEEIFSQEKALKRTFDYITENFENIFGKINNLIKDRKISKIIFTGMGSSYFCCYVPFYMLKQKSFDVEMIEAGEFLQHCIPEDFDFAYNHTCIILISQSGESGEIVELLKKLNLLGLKPFTIGVTNTPRSYLANHSDMQLYLSAGKEETVTSKTYVCSILILYFLASFIITKKLSIKSKFKEFKEFKEFYEFNEFNEINELLTFISNLFQFNKSSETPIQPIQGINKLFGNDYNFIQILARGPSLSTAHQAALNFKEIVKIYSEALPISTFRHGGIECLTERTKLVILSSSKKDHMLDNRFIRNLIEKWRFGVLFYITTQELRLIDKEICNNPKIIIYTYDIRNHFLATIVEIVILQFMIYDTAVKRGLSPGLFKYTQKITRGL